MYEDVGVDIVYKGVFYIMRGMSLCLEAMVSSPCQANRQAILFFCSSRVTTLLCTYMKEKKS
jgi:hypothetical protein